MIRIQLPESMEYRRLRREYLKRVAKYIKFDKKDIFPDQTSLNEGKTETTATYLQEHFQNLYRFLFSSHSGKVRTENLRWLLAGPAVPPKSFGGTGEYETMQDSLKAIIGQCSHESGEDSAKANEVCKKIFDYDEFVKKQEDAYWLLRSLKVRVCPYCNRIYTTTLPTKEELEQEDSGEPFETTRATYDHFYGKAQYPYLALSLFNLVPSCNICNNNKESKDEEIIYPYDEEFGKNAVFRLIPDLKELKPGENALRFLTGESDKFHVRLMGKDRISFLEKSFLESQLSDIEDLDYRERVKNSIEMFRLEKLYNEHKVEIRDVLRNRYYFNEEYVKSAICPLIREQLKKEGTNVSEDQVYDMATDMLFSTRLRPEEWKDRPLSKLKADILDYIDIITKEEE